MSNGSSGKTLIKKHKAPLIEIVAGPNGSGKTTFAESFLVKIQKNQAYLNPDLIASGFHPQPSIEASFQAGRVFITEVKNKIQNSESFAFESTLSGKTWIYLLKEARDKNYRIRIYYLYLDTIKSNLKRIKKRVTLGGHDIPREAVKRRHPRCFENFWFDYKELAHEWFIFNNTSKVAKELMNYKTFKKLSEVQKADFEKSFLLAKLPFQTQKNKLK